jgi:N-acetylmuramoyl-L-alanine amidase
MAVGKGVRMRPVTLWYSLLNPLGKELKVKAIGLCVVIFLCSAISALAVPKICIDPGHGGSDSGAVGNGLYEKNLNLSTAKKMKAWLDKDTKDSNGGNAWQVLMTRNQDAYVSLAARSSYANSNRVSRFFSIHHDSWNAGANGSGTFIYTSTGSTTTDLGNKVQQELVQHGGLKDRGLRRANFHVLRETSMPAVLTENGFISDAGDAQKISNPSWQDNVAKGFLHALQRHYGKNAYTPSTGGESHIVGNESSNFSATSNWRPATWSSQKNGASYHFRKSASVHDPAKWEVDIEQAGYYKVYAWWTSAGDRSSRAPYIVGHSSGQSTVRKNQQADGGKWNSLGTYWLNSGKNSVSLSCWAPEGAKVIADAIKWQQ